MAAIFASSFFFSSPNPSAPFFFNPLQTSQRAEPLLLCSARCLNFRTDGSDSFFMKHRHCLVKTPLWGGFDSDCRGQPAEVQHHVAGETNCNLSVWQSDTSPEATVAFRIPKSTIRN